MLVALCNAMAFGFVLAATLAKEWDEIKTNDRNSNA